MPAGNGVGGEKSGLGVKFGCRLHLLSQQISPHNGNAAVSGRIGLVELPNELSPFLQCETCGSRCSVATIKSGFQAMTSKRAAIRAKAQ